jgi:predicted NodU family carbamoyl transferase
MESGPRALGNRSILMSANRAENKDIINVRVKFRESVQAVLPFSLSGESEMISRECARRAFHDHVIHMPAGKNGQRFRPSFTWTIRFDRKR